ncbi:small nuclear ribonucleoprotein Sm D-like protein isoform X3 [Dendroctonus ponderosae]|uniref:small nuclear ribonucleoprotein Sm D-like protein isoform X3 n=1 Tax=Dendroctonus ponderosae TaxID=77166 RepID=UPI0020365A6A|nr:small nuclear ribonucleoprotein Sm D-like protein isoform X3 [Dendroctonus ponderosae]XP_048524590.1 small nuclear ribonucleoprotein Sm D-like protein isoform X3 [Dendroctonus ponderosae]
MHTMRCRCALPVATTKPARSNKNVILKMETMQGPLALLRKYTTERTRIKIITRNEKGVRGYCMAYLLAFDKHFNLVLDKVDEVWHRSIKVNKSPLLIDSVPENINSSSRKRANIPTIERKKISKNTEECRRHVNQMLMRGEHVVLICVPNAEHTK